MLARSLDKVGRMKSVVVMIHWDDESVDFDWSSMNVSDLVWLERSFGQAVTKEIYNPNADFEAVPPKAS